MYSSSPKISIIVPVYKAEAYLHRCVDSILAQTFTDFELLLIEDGSPDSCACICDEYAKKDSRVRVFHKENGGVSSARNVGLDNARGEWIAFCDSDDWVDKDYLTIHGYEGVDVIQKGFVCYSEADHSEKICLVNNEIIQDQEQLFCFFVRHRNNALWDKIIAKRIIGINRFNEQVKIGEDFLFALSILPRIKRYAFSTSGYYYYVIHEHSAMSLINLNRLSRMKIIEDNINHVINLTMSPMLRELRQGLIYGSYVPFMLSNYKILTNSQHILLEQLISDLDYKDLRYLSCRELIKLYIKIIIRKLL